jgi:glutamate racemase
LNLFKASPIGVFDSGIGGLPILSQLYHSMPDQTFIYFADTAYAPYGEKTEQQIQERCFKVVEYLLSQGAQAIVVACNTATMVSIKALRQRYDVPFIGVEPGVKPGAIHTRSGVVGVLATGQTLKSDSFFHLVQRVAGHVTLALQPCPRFVELVEGLQLEGEAVVAAARDYVTPLVEADADVVILGCTHFSFLAPVIRSVLPLYVEVISTEEAVAKEVVRRLGDRFSGHFSIVCITSGDITHFHEQLNVLLKNVTVDQVKRVNLT